MPRYIKGKTIIEIESAVQGVRLKADGFKEIKTPVKAVKPRKETTAAPDTTDVEAPSE